MIIWNYRNNRMVQPLLPALRDVAVNIDYLVY